MKLYQVHAAKESNRCGLNSGGSFRDSLGVRLGYQKSMLRSARAKHLISPYKLKSKKSDVVLFYF